MKWVKTGAVVLVTLCLLILVGKLPDLVAKAQDDAAMLPGLGEIRSVDLVLKEPLSLIEKLYVMANGQYYPYSVNTKLTVDQLPGVVEEALAPYYYRDLIPYNWEDTVVRGESYILYRTDEPQINFVLWIVTLENANWRADIHLDDDTGRLLMVHFSYTSPVNVFNTGSYASELKYAWFEAMGFSIDTWLEERSINDGNIGSLRCTYADAREITVEFTTYPSGFWQLVTGN